MRRGVVCQDEVKRNVGIVSCVRNSAVSKPPRQGPGFLTESPSEAESDEEIRGDLNKVTL